MAWNRRLQSRWLGADRRARLIYELPRPAHDGRTRVRLSPLELLDRLAA